MKNYRDKKNVFHTFYFIMIFSMIIVLFMACSEPATRNSLLKEFELDRMNGDEIAVIINNPTTDELNKITNLKVFEYCASQESLLIIPVYNNMNIEVKTLIWNDNDLKEDATVYQDINTKDGYALLLKAIRPCGIPSIKICITDKDMVWEYILSYDGEKGIPKIEYITKKEESIIVSEVDEKNDEFCGDANGQEIEREGRGEDISKIEDEEDTLRETILKGTKVVAKRSDQEGKMIELYIKNLETGEEELFETLQDVYIDHYHYKEYHNHNLYLIRRIGYDGSHSQNWSDELWKYDNNKNGTKLYSYKGFDFRVAPNEEKIAIRSDNKLVIISSTGEVLKEYEVEELDYFTDPDNWIELLKWSKDSMYFWGTINWTYDVYALYKLDVKTWGIEKYDITKASMGLEFDFNAEEELLVYSDFPVFLDHDEYERFMSTEREVNLYVFNLKTQEIQLIATSKNKEFNPVWLDSKRIEYDNPVGEGRVIYSLKNSF